MKKSLFVFFLILIVGGTSSFACDFCNCYLGLDPGYNKNTVGIRSNFRYATHMIPSSGSMKLMHGDHGDGTSGAEERMDGYFAGFDLFARVYPIKKLQVIATIPFQVNTLMFEDKEESRSALSDLTVMALYQIANTMPSDSLSCRHRVFAGGGVKFPSGKSSGASDADIPMAHHLYSGTGSTDLIAAVSYIGKYRKFGWNADVSYKFNGESANDYRYGNTFNAGPRIFYEVAVKSVRLLPHIGSAFEYGDHDQYRDNKLENTGGSVLWGTAGADVYLGKFSLTTDVRIPVVMDLGSSVMENRYWVFSSINFHF
jgi:hypothetical protein